MEKAEKEYYDKAKNKSDSERQELFHEFTRKRDAAGKRFKDVLNRINEQAESMEIVCERIEASVRKHAYK